MARMSPHDRRESIVAAAMLVMERQGIAATTVRDVAAELGTSSGLIHHYVDSMDDLLAEAFARAAGDDLERTRAAVTLGRDPVERLALFFDAYARADDDFGMQRWLDAWAEAARRPALQRASRQLNEAWHLLLASIIRDGVSDGSMTCDDVDAAAWRVLSLLDGLMLQVVAHGALAVGQVDSWSRAGAERELGLRAGALSAIGARTA